MNRDLADDAVSDIEAVGTADVAAAGEGPAPHARPCADRGYAARPPARPLRVAIIHDWLVTYAGAERVL